MCHIIVRFVFVTIVAGSLQIKTFLVEAQQAYEVDLHQAINDKALYGQAFLNLTNTPIVECFEYCVKHCSCTTFEICQKTECKLLSSNRFLTPSSLLPLLGCIYYDMKPRKQVSPFCSSVLNCCKTSKPCLNGGICLPPLPSSENRFRCDCLDNFEGDRCEQCIPGYTGQHCDHPIRSCRGYDKGSRVAGNYTVFDVNNNTFEVFCDFDGNSSMTWTLIQSYSLDNNNLFKLRALRYDYSQNQNEFSWSRYRLSKSRMESIQQDSTKWRVTCRYESDGVVYTDYLRASNTELNILTFVNQRCVKMEYLDVRGKKCTNCTAYMREHNGKMLHLFYGDQWATVLNCDFRLLRGTHFEIEGYLGYYFGHYYAVDNQHRCSSSGGATTQTWFGA